MPSELFQSEDQLFHEAGDRFHELFSSEPNIKAFAPGRVNIIGEHTDYNDGYVFPMALSMGTVVVGSKNGSHECNVYTMSPLMAPNMSATFKIPVDDVVTKSTIPWVNYVLGVVAYFPYNQKAGFNAVINSSVPLGSGLSSSASLEVAMYTFLEGLYEVKDEINLAEKALVCQKAEHNYAGVPCGIMDQFISFMGKKDHALCIDCRDLSRKLVKMNDGSVDVLIVNSNVKHNLGTSEYPLRRQHCHSVAQLLGKTALRDLHLKELQDMVHKMDPVAYIRARHVVTENQRVLDAIDALEKSDFGKLGLLMNKSHASLRDDFQVSCKEVDELVEITQPLEGVFGSRMTGGGFGGCTVSLVVHSYVNNVIDQIKKRFSGQPQFYICKASAGAHRCD